MTKQTPLQARIAAAAAQTDMNEASKGGGTRTLPEQGMVRLRLISYIELGIHDDEYKGVIKKPNKVVLQFELSGPKHPPTTLEDGRVIPQVITINEKISLNEKANFYKLFKRMNHTGTFTHMAEMLGTEFLGTVVHVTKGEGADAKSYANLRDDGGYTIRPPFVEDAETGESKRITVAPALTPIKCFLWDYACKEDWDSIFIDGVWDDRKDATGKVTEVGRSKNFYQQQIKAANNFAGSAIADLLFAGLAEPDLDDAETPDRSDDDIQAGVERKSKAAADPLEGVA